MRAPAGAAAGPPPASQPTAERTSPERLRAQVFEFWENKRARADLFRRNCALLHQIRDEGAWAAGGELSFDAWCLRTLGLKRPQVTQMLGIATGPIGGRGRAGRPPSGTADRGRAREGQEGQVEELPDPGNSSTSPSTTVDLSPAAAAPLPRGTLAWAVRTLASIEAAGVAAVVGGIAAADRAVAAGVFVTLAECFLDCAQRAASVGPEEDDG